MTPSTLRAGLSHLFAVDPVLAAYGAKVAGLDYHPRPLDLARFIAVVVNQQLSDKAAATIFKRVLKVTGDPPPPQRVANLDPQALRDCGLSFGKVGYIQGVAAKLAAEPEWLGGLSQLSADQAMAELATLKGIGAWSAGNLALFGLGHADVLIRDDVSINKVVARLYGADLPLKYPQLKALTEAWRPYRSVGCLLLWHLYDKDLL